jgi:hypothetical protein
MDRTHYRPWFWNRSFGNSRRLLGHVHLTHADNREPAQGQRREEHDYGSKPSEKGQIFSDAMNCAADRPADLGSPRRPGGTDRDTDDKPSAADRGQPCPQARKWAVGARRDDQPAKQDSDSGNDLQPDPPTGEAPRTIRGIAEMEIWPYKRY